jgi:hypothetical protein
LLEKKWVPLVPIAQLVLRGSLGLIVATVNAGFASPAMGLDGPEALCEAYECSAVASSKGMASIRVIFIA